MEPLQKLRYGNSYSVVSLMVESSDGNIASVILLLIFTVRLNNSLLN